MLNDFFRQLGDWERTHMLNLFEQVKDALSNGLYQDGLGAALSEFVAMDVGERDSAIRNLREPAQAALDDVLAVLTDEQAESVAYAFPEWAAGIGYMVGERVRHGGVLYKCIQAHDAQEGWEPASASSLWARVLADPSGEVAEWVQPDSTNPYMMGDRVTHGGVVYESTVDNNVWEPGVYGWEEV